MIERLFPPPAPQAPALDIAQLQTLVTSAAREAAREAVAEALATVRAPLSAPAPEPAPEPTAVLAGELAESVERATEPAPPAPAPAPTRNALTADREAALDLFIGDCIDRAGTGALTVSEIAAAYDRWRKVIDAPALPNTAHGANIAVGKAMTRAGIAKVRADIPGGSSKVMTYPGTRLREGTDQEDHSATPAPEPAPQPPTLLIERRARARDTYDGPYPGMELKHKEMREAVRALLRSGKGWSYARCNGNGSGKPRLISPDGRTFTLPNTPSDNRALKNTLATLRRAQAQMDAEALADTLVTA